jgi:gamma-glutamylcysteine synthetase
MRYLVFFSLFLAFCLFAVLANENCNGLLTTIEQQAQFIQQDLKIALKQLAESSQRRSEMQSIIDSSKKRIERLEKITNDSKLSYQQRIAGLKELVRQLEERLSEAEELNASLADIEERTMREIDAARHSRDLVASVGIGLAAGMLGYELTSDPLVGLGSAVGAGLLSYFALRFAF